MHTTPRPQLISSRPSAAAPNAPAQPRNIDGVIGKPRPRAIQHNPPARAAMPAQHPNMPVAASKPQVHVKPHLQAHPMLRRQFDTDVRPARPAQAPHRNRTATPHTQPHVPDGRPGTSHSAPHTAGSRPTVQATLPPVARELGTTPFDRLADKLDAMHLSKLALVGLTMTALLIGLSLFSLQLGELVLAVYAVIAIWKRLTSRLSFALALATFGGIIITQLVSPDSGIADNLAVYAFLLLCIGTISLAREVRRGDTKPAPARS